jgi:hypothetical protein
MSLRHLATDHGEIGPGVIYHAGRWTECENCQGQRAAQRIRTARERREAVVAETTSKPRSD